MIAEPGPDKSAVKSGVSAPASPSLLADVETPLNAIFRDTKSLKFPIDQQFLWSLSIVG